MTVGPWKPIKLHTYHTHITDVDIRSTVSESLAVELTVEFVLSEKKPGFASVHLKNPDGTLRIGESKIETSPGKAKAGFSFSPGVLDLWYPVGYGKQPIYTVEVQIADEVKKSP